MKWKKVCPFFLYFLQTFSRQQFQKWAKIEKKTKKQNMEGMASSVRRSFSFPPHRVNIWQGTLYREKEGGLERFNMTSTASTRIYTKKGKSSWRGEGRRKNGAKKKKHKASRVNKKRESESQKKRENDFSSILRKEEDGGLKKKRVWGGNVPHAQ